MGIEKQGSVTEIPIDAAIQSGFLIKAIFHGYSGKRQEYPMRPFK